MSHAAAAALLTALALRGVPREPPRRHCCGCHRPIRAGEGYRRRGGLAWHPHCPAPGGAADGK
jgi:recombinational DNA repair protein (RecF pathway)